MRNRSIRRRAAGLLVAATLAVTTSACGNDPAPTPVLKAGTFDPPHVAPDFALRGAGGSQIDLTRSRGKVVLLTFGFTSCAAVCPTTLATLAQARQALGDAGDRVQVIFVTVDPDRDTAAKLKDYVRSFDPTFVGATGSPQALAAARQKYGVTATREDSGPDYAMAHTSSIFLIDPAGKLRAVMPYGRDASDYVHDIKLLLG